MSKYTPEQIEAAKAVVFESRDLNVRISVVEWMKRLLSELFYEEEGFSGKRPFGNSGWKQDAEVALIKAGFLEGSLDQDGYIDDCEDSGALFEAIIRSLK